MDKLTAIKIKYNDGTYSDEIPVSVLSENVEWDSTHTLVDVLGSIDVKATGTIQDQISRLFNEKVSITQLNNYVANQLNTDVANWLNTNVNPVGSAVVVDSSLTISGAAADAKVVGDLKSALSYDESVLFGLDKHVTGKYRPQWQKGKTFEAHGYGPSGGWACSEVIPAGTYKITPINGYKYEIYYYNSDSSGTVAWTNRTGEGTYALTNDFIISASPSRMVTDDDIYNLHRDFFILVNSGTINEKIKSLEITDDNIKNAVLEMKKPLPSNQDILSISWIRGEFGSTGYNNSARWYNTGVLGAGKYSVYIPNGFRFEVYQYNSDSSGTLVVSPRTVSSDFTASEDLVISFGPADGSNVDIWTTAEMLKKITIIKHNPYIANGENTVDIFNSTPDWNYGTGEIMFDSCNGKTLFKSTTNDNGISRLSLVLKEGINPEGINKYTLRVNIPDASKVASVTLSFSGISARRSATNIVNGWNNLEFYLMDADLTTFNTITAIVITVGATEQTYWYLDSIKYEKKSKGWLIFIEDGGLSTFFEKGYPTLKSLGVPVTLAYDCGTPGKDAGDRGHQVTVAEVKELFDEGYIEMSYHGWDSNKRTATMTAQEIRAETAKCLEFLQVNGWLPEHTWRAAHTQNDAPNAMAQKGMVEALTTGTSAAGKFHTFPFLNKWNIDRVGIHGRTTAYIDSIFDVIKKVHCGTVLYTHGISSLSEYDITPELWEYFIGKVQTGIQEGWLLPTTYNELANGILD